MEIVLDIKSRTDSFFALDTGKKGRFSFGRRIPRKSIRSNRPGGGTGGFGRGNDGDGGKSDGDSGDKGGIEDAIQDFLDALPGQNKRLGEAEFGLGLGDIDTQLSDIVAAGGRDPAFDALEASRQEGLEGQRARALSDTSSFFARRGFGGSSAELNKRDVTGERFDMASRGITAEMGFAALERAGAARTERVGVSESRDVATNLGLEAGQTSLQNLLAEPALLIAELAAKTKEKDSGGNGLSCCFIILEANGWPLHPVVRKYRDEHMTDRNRRGYYKVAEVLVPLMRKSRTVHNIVKWGMAEPLTAYGKWYYRQNRWGWILAPVKSFWMNLFEYLGRVK